MRKLCSYVGLRIAVVPTIVFSMCFPMHSLADAGDRSSAPYLRAGAIELGLSGSITVIEGISRAAVTVRTGTFTQVPGGLAGIEMELSYSHVSSLDWIDLQGNLSLQRAWGQSSAYPYIALGGGLRQEWLGSFRQVRYPVGFNLGLRALVGQQAALRAEYKFRRILHDPVSNFSEHQLVVGLSIFFKNSR